MIGRTGKCLRISLFEDTGKNVPHSYTWLSKDACERTMSLLKAIKGLSAL